MKEFGNLERIAGNHLPSHVCGFKMFRLLQLCEKSKVQRFPHLHRRCWGSMRTCQISTLATAQMQKLQIWRSSWPSTRHIPKSAGDSSMEMSSMYIWCEKKMESYCTPNCWWRLSFQLLESRKQQFQSISHIWEIRKNKNIGYHWIIHIYTWRISHIFPLYRKVKTIVRVSCLGPLFFLKEVGGVATQLGPGDQALCVCRNTLGCLPITMGIYGLHML